MSPSALVTVSLPQPQEVSRGGCANDSKEPGFVPLKLRDAGTQTLPCRWPVLDFSPSNLSETSASAGVEPLVWPQPRGRLHPDGSHRDASCAASFDPRDPRGSRYSALSSLETEAQR